MGLLAGDTDDLGSSICTGQAGPALCLCLPQLAPHSELMNTTSPQAHLPIGPKQIVPPSSRTLSLAAHAPVQRLRCPASSLSVIHVRQGRVWLTREGRPEDVFLAAGERWQVAGDATLHLSAEGAEPALLELRIQPWSGQP